MFGCCCSSGPTISNYAIMWSHFGQAYNPSAPLDPPARWLAPYGFQPIVPSIPSGETFKAGKAPLHYIGSGSPFSSHAWRKFAKQTVVSTSVNGYTKTVVSEKTSIITGTQTDTTTYVPDFATWAADFGFSDTYTSIDETNGSTTAEITYHCDNGNTIDYFWELPIADADVFAGIEDEKFDTIAWSTVGTGSPDTYGGKAFWLPNEYGFYQTKSGGSYIWNSAGGGVPFEGEFAVNWDFTYIALQGTTPDVAHPAYGYAMKGVIRTPYGKEYYIMRLKVEDVGVCLQKCAIDPATGCPIGSITFATQTTAVVEADNVALMTDIGEGDPLLWNGTYWVYPASPTPEALANIVVPYSGANHSTVVACGTLHHQTRYRYVGAQIGVLDVTPPTCNYSFPAAIPDASSTDVAADSIVFTADAGDPVATKEAGLKASAGRLLLKLDAIEAATASKGKAWYDDVLSAGIIRCPYLEISALKWNAISLRHRQFGDAFATIAQPIAKAIGMDPNCSGCAKRGATLNGGSPLIKSDL